MKRLRKGFARLQYIALALLIAVSIAVGSILSLVIITLLFMSAGPLLLVGLILLLIVSALLGGWR